MKTKNETSEILITPVEKKVLNVKIAGVEGSSLITHRLSEKTVGGFMNREIGKTNKKKIRNYDEEYESCFYYTPDKKYGIIASAFMASILDAAVACKIPKTQVKRAVRILGDILPLKYKKINRRIDYPRRSGRNGTPDTRHRPEFIDWSTTLTILYDANQITPDQIINLINQAGFSSGVGDWRPSAPSSSGTHGMYRVI